MQVLVVDDYAPTRQFIEASLRRAGHEVTTAAHGAIGCRMLADKVFDVIITDLFMPELDGLEFLRHIRTLAGDTPVVVISGGADALHQQYLGAASKLGAAAVLAKPFEAQELVGLITSVAGDSAS